MESAARSAGFTSFAGDFLVAHRAEDRAALSLVLVDVSGKGVDAGTRSLLLSGALGGLIGAVSPDRFLPSANEFLLRQAWDEGFATAVHVHLDLVTGDYEIRSAGHPPAIGFLAGSGRWHLHDEAEGPALGLLETADFPKMQGRLGRDDALLLYTDGLVERPGRDISLGIDRLLGEGERRIRQGFVGSARELVDKLGAANDDCTVVVLGRH
jgi:serine phosphatase RsbU (regulator of sigma subunit)